jgi:CheY-like chemotaxis protein
MPQMSGVQLAQALRELRGDSLRCILLTSMGAAPEAAPATRDRHSAQIPKPVKKAALRDAILRSLERKAGARAPAANSSTLPADLAQRHPLRILVAEDNPVNVKLIKIMLGRMGYEVDVAGNGLEALAALERQPYDLILMDVQMPQMDGIEAARRICGESGVAPRPRIIALTAAVMPEERRACLDAGMDGLLNKPIEAQKLVEALSDCPRL